jgi:hypothetical protein
LLLIEISVTNSGFGNGEISSEREKYAFTTPELELYEE